MKSVSSPSLIPPFGELPVQAGSCVDPTVVAGTAPGTAREVVAARRWARRHHEEPDACPVFGVNRFGS